MKRIGILCVHGIGDQPRFQHVDKVARDIRDHLCSIYGDEKVFTEASPGIYTRALRPSVSFLVSNDGETICFDLIEVWWRDLGERPGFKRLVRFWWWALTLWTTAGFGKKPATGRALPRRMQASNTFKVGIFERLRLFFYSLSFFVLLLPLQLVLSVLSLIPFVRRIDILRSVYAYMSSVKIYEQYKNDTIQDILDFSVPRRIRIQQRVVSEILSVAESEFSSWFILAHSLGSVIAFKALMYDGSAFGRALPFERWNSLPKEWKMVDTPSEDYVDKPALPPWMNNNDFVDLKRVYSKFGGLITYGSPIETFATLWPSIVEINKDVNYLKAPWINLHDTRDFISAPILSMGGLEAVLPVTNIAIDSHWLIIKSHTGYLANRTGGDELSTIIRGMPSIGLFDVKSKNIRVKVNAMHIFAITVQVIFILGIGAIILPVAIAGLWEAIVGVVGALDRIIVDKSLPNSIYERMDVVTRYLDNLRLRIDEDGNVRFAGVLESLFLFGAALLAVGAAKAFARYTMKWWNPDSQRPLR